MLTGEYLRWITIQYSMRRSSDTLRSLHAKKTGAVADPGGFGPDPVKCFHQITDDLFPQLAKLTLKLKLVPRKVQYNIHLEPANTLFNLAWPCLNLSQMKFSRKRER